MITKIKSWMASFFKKEEIEVEVIEVKEEKQAVATYHAKERLEQRHGEVLTDEMTTSFVNDIKSGKADFLSDTRGDTQAWIVTYKNKKYKVIYNYETEVLVTIYSNTKDKKIKSGRRRKNKIQKRMHLYDSSIKREKTRYKKPYKRNKRVEYNEVI
jgi:hypothetical protein